MNRIPCIHLRSPWTAGRLDSQITPFPILLALVLLLGIFARVWEFGSLPPGLRADETLAAVDAYSLYRFGVDHNAESYPLVMIGGGSGVSALYEYLLIPSIAIGGMDPLAVRIPILLAGILSLPLMFIVGRRVAGGRFGLIAMFLLAISPWHILASRRGHEAHLLPFIFLLAFACLLKSTTNNRWFIGAAALFALCLYAYAPAYACVPLFLALSVAILLITKRVRLRIVVAGLAVFALLATPIVLFLVINALKLDTIHLGFLTIPRLPVRPRFQTQSQFGEDVLGTLVTNALSLLSLLWKQNDGLPWNSVDPFGYFYRCTFPVAVIGAGLLIPLRNIRASAERLLVLAWLIAAAALGLLQSANINRVNLIFIPLLLCIAMCLDWLARRSRAVLVVAVCAFLIVFALFTREYHGPRYRYAADFSFYNGFLQALDSARQVDDNPICVTMEGVDEPYVFVLFLEKLDPAEYVPTIVYANPRASFRHPTRLGRYRFYLNDCPSDLEGAVFVLNQTETIPNAQTYAVQAFGNFHVYTP